MLPQERECWRMVAQTAEPQSIEGTGFRIAGWPVHEPDWRREILRTWHDDSPIDVD
jgi:hypothetical protein